MRPPPRFTLFPYTTLFRSRQRAAAPIHGPRHGDRARAGQGATGQVDRKSARLNSSHTVSSYADFYLKKKAAHRTRDVGRAGTHAGRAGDVVTAGDGRGSATEPDRPRGGQARGGVEAEVGGRLEGCSTRDAKIGRASGSDCARAQIEGAGLEIHGAS